MGMMRRSVLLQISIFLLLFAGALFPPPALPVASTEYQVKAAFLYNFAKFVEWPPEAFPEGRPFIIGILGQDPFGSALDEAVAGKTVREKRIVVRRFSKIEEAADSHILFISESEGENLPRLLKRLGPSPVLTVSDVGRFAEQGGMVQLVMEQSRVRFAINVASVERAGMKPSSQLLKLARIVNAQPPIVE
jgi:hypothetical protein